ncbi:MAG: ABC transporter permease [Burkholderiaceae bacterium]|nr:ABC transporter permease [Burkholderiaceae bacterium]
MPLLIGLSLLVFVIGRVLPGDPAGLAAGPYATMEQRAAIAAEYGLDQPIPVQYLTYITGIFEGDFGRSLMTRRPVAGDLAAYLPATVELVIFSLTLAVVIGIPLGLIAGSRRNQAPDIAISSGTLAAMSMPQFFLGLMLQLLFGMALAWLPLSGRLPYTISPPTGVTGLYTVDSLLSGRFDALWMSLVHLTLPALTMALAPIATIARIMRASTIEVLQQDYVLSERAAGLSPRRILFKYVFKNAASATLTTVGLYVGWMLGSTVLVEKVFDWPGIGLYATNAILSQDFNPVIAVTLAIGVIFIVSNLVVDLLYGVLNPKLR